jgi:hypothetical protein
MEFAKIGMHLLFSINSRKIVASNLEQHFFIYFTSLEKNSEKK